MSFSFGGPPKTASGFTLPNTNTPTTAASTGFQLNTGAGDNKTLLQSKPGTVTTGLTFGATFPPKTATTTLGFGASQANTASVAPTLNLGGTTIGSSAAPSNPQFGLGTTSVAASGPAASFTPILGKTTASTGLTVGSVAPATSAAPKLAFGLAPAIAATPATTHNLGPATSATSTAPASVTATAVSTIPSSGSLTFGQLEDSINKWTIDLEEQGKFFINQAKQLNAWDSLLISNGEKVLNLNCSIERVKQQQQQLDQELDFVLSQQKELEELITPLEKELVEIPVTDIDRNQMYQFSEIIDSQLKQMSEDLKEIIEHINESHKDEETSNPVTQISRILNAHMNSLQWIDENSTQISAHLEQIAKMQDTNRRNIPLNQSFNM